MTSITKKSVLKGFVVTTVAVVGLQGMAFAAASKPLAPVADGKYALSQDAGKNISKDSNAAPMQVAAGKAISANPRNAPDPEDPCYVYPYICG
ncbi:Uncharacterized protein ALO57_00167 [Pseudomonas coronafaciens pv. oryzae]|uniref:hypothetical protein n=1 Tax=Pseudomonas coronafaciens TaxID=53409 RepID=UPI0006B538BC|nr:hypothetical protein [Pseudomonas coronafaciens]KPB51332.1 Uncharacterized protein AC511_1490 [Pseudomonas coronafaciens pv. oryzae]KPY06241.1 Uncharacterized protein ALO57_00167 [Pseudomonas coronafaciens pv. oryzae]RMT08502.1 hypothetical protein ALP55_03737 [Pseudomonas coronafaciens pv. oryzae]